MKLKRMRKNKKPEKKGTSRTQRSHPERLSHFYTKSCRATMRAHTHTYIAAHPRRPRLNHKKGRFAEVFPSENEGKIKYTRIPGIA